MPRLAVRKLELCETIVAPEVVEGYEGVRFYCTLHGQMLGHFTIWNNYRPIDRAWLLHELSNNATLLLSRPFLGVSPDDSRAVKMAIEKLIVGYLTGRRAEEF